MSLTMVSCEKFLEEKPYDFIGSSNFYKTEGDANAALNGAFSSLQPQTYFGRTSWIVNELSGDLMKVNASLADRDNLYAQAFDANNGEIGNWWNSTYNLINRSNDVIKNVPNIVMDVTKRNNIVGNARFLRAMGYFDLVRSYGAIPLILVPTEDLSNLKPARASIADIYKSIIEDLKYAEANCTAENLIPTTAKGRVSNGAATSLLAKVYLTKATTTAKESTDYSNSLAASNKVIASGLYSLVSYKNVFDVTTENNAEHIFSVQFDLPPNVGNIVVRMHLPASLNGTGSFVAEKSFEDSFISTDTRKALTLGRVSSADANAYYSKFADPLRQTNNARNNVLILRYADVLLMQSEALNEINALDPNKLTGINAVRARAIPNSPLPLLLANVLTRDAFVDALVQERAWEFSAEGNRRYDLLRLGRYKQRQLAVFNRTVDDKYLLFPIPQTEIDLNPNLKPQNPGF